MPASKKGGSKRKADVIDSEVSADAHADASQQQPAEVLKKGRKGAAAHPHGHHASAAEVAAAAVSASEEFDDNSILNLATTLAKKAGELILANINDRAKAVVTKSGSADCVTETDKACEALIIGGIQKKYPNHLFIAEESHEGKYNFTDNPTWIVDPIDGTNNFVHGLPHTCVSIAFMVHGEVRVGVVHCPTLNETFHAIRGGGAFCNGAPIRVSEISELPKAALVTEFGYDRSSAGVDAMLSKLRALLTEGRVQSVRFYGSCCLNMCNIARGKLEVYYEGVDVKQGPKPWDVAASALILREAGGLVLDTRISSGSGSGGSNGNAEGDLDDEEKKKEGKKKQTKKQQQQQQQDEADGKDAHLLPSGWQAFDMGSGRVFAANNAAIAGAVLRLINGKTAAPAPATAAAAASAAGPAAAKGSKKGKAIADEDAPAATAAAAGPKKKSSSKKGSAADDGKVKEDETEEKSAPKKKSGAGAAAKATSAAEAKKSASSASSNKGRRAK